MLAMYPLWYSRLYCMHFLNIYTFESLFPPRAHRHPVVLVIIFTCVVFLMIITLMVAVRFLFIKLLLPKKDLPVVSYQSDPDNVIKDVKRFWASLFIQVLVFWLWLQFSVTTVVISSSDIQILYDLLCCMGKRIQRSRIRLLFNNNILWSWLMNPHLRSEHVY